MGADRDKLPDEKPSEPLHFSDESVCKYYICGFCPHTLFTNTKSDLGACNKVHDDECRREFQKVKQEKHYPYEGEFLRELEHLIMDLDKKIRRGHDRLTQQQGPAATVEDRNLQVEMISEKMVMLLIEMEDLGAQGKLEEAEALDKLINQLKEEKENILAGGAMKEGPTQEKRLKVCEICGAFLVIGDTDRRTASHLEGKQHIGYAKIRDTIKEMRKNRHSGYDSGRRRHDRRGDYNRKRSRDDYSRGRSDRNYRDRRSRSGGRYDDYNRSSKRRRRERD
eukprot:TRINITY_DN927_c0_g1_i2.p1 TRINITY_DN927_c0_g1~~TRINITY_DN927_c0_g1_i2.p1  ORF type:complete len:280 (-),score=36.38 TRINITY_DN927_c0_g1_i2:360-1199(-)